MPALCLLSMAGLSCGAALPPTTPDGVPLRQSKVLQELAYGSRHALVLIIQIQELQEQGQISSVPYRRLKSVRQQEVNAHQWTAWVGYCHSNSRGS